MNSFNYHNNPKAHIIITIPIYVWANEKHRTVGYSVKLVRERGFKARCSKSTVSHCTIQPPYRWENRIRGKVICESSHKKEVAELWFESRISLKLVWFNFDPTTSKSLRRVSRGILPWQKPALYLSSAPRRRQESDMQSDLNLSLEAWICWVTLDESLYISELQFFLPAK